MILYIKQVAEEYFYLEITWIMGYNSISFFYEHFMQRKGDGIC